MARDRDVHRWPLAGAKSSDDLVGNANPGGGLAVQLEGGWLET
jgi:hypothetical protein